MPPPEDGVVDFLEHSGESCRVGVAVTWQEVSDDSLGAGRLVGIVELLQELRKMWGLTSLTGTKNRAMLTEWEEKLGFAPELILTAAEAANGTERPMYYLDTVLRAYARKGIRTKEQILEERQARKTKDGAAKAGKPLPAQQYSQRDYSDEDEEAFARMLATAREQGF